MLWLFSKVIRLVVLGFALNILGVPCYAQDSTSLSPGDEVHAAEARAKDFVTQLAQAGLTVMADATLSDQKKKEALRGILESNFDLPAIANFVLGPGQTLTDAEQTQYQALFEEMILRIYCDQLRLLVIQDFKIKSVSHPDEDNKITVASIVNTANQSDPVDVKWTLSIKPSQIHKVVDVAVSDISLSVIQAHEIRSLLAQEGDIQGLLRRMSEKFGSPRA